MSYVPDNLLIMDQIPVYKVVGNERKYTLLQRELGRGQFAKTMLASTYDTQVYVACKMIEKQALISWLNRIQDREQAQSVHQKLIQRLNNEIRQMESLRHPNIVQFIQMIESPNNFYIFMEYCPGGTLQMLLKRGRIAEQEALVYFKQLAEGCKYLYEKGVIHRDLKTSNVLIAEDGSLKIADFGFAKELGENLRDIEFQNTPWIGTPLYMSPQVIGQGNYSIKTDVWSLGCIFYEILFGGPPFYHADFHKLQDMIINQPVRFPQEPEISEPLQALITNMLSKLEKGRLAITEVVSFLNQYPK